MAEKKKDRPNITSPKGVIKFANLSTPNTRFKKDGEYDVQLLFEPTNPEYAKLVAFLQEEHDKGYAEAMLPANNPKKKKYVQQGIANMAKEDVNKDNEPTGKMIVKFKHAAGGVTQAGKVWTWRPALFMARPFGAVVPGGTVIYGGSVVDVSYQINHNAMETGAFYTSLSLQAVRVYILKDSFTRDASTYGFGAVADDEDGQDSFGEQAPAGADSGNDSTDF